MSGLQCLTAENIWFDKHRYDEAERRFYEGVNGSAVQQQQVKHLFPHIPINERKKPHSFSLRRCVGQITQVIPYVTVRFQGQRVGDPNWSPPCQHSLTSRCSLTLPTLRLGNAYITAWGSCVRAKPLDIAVACPSRRSCGLAAVTSQAAAVAAGSTTA